MQRNWWIFNYTIFHFETLSRSFEVFPNLFRGSIFGLQITSDHPKIYLGSKEPRKMFLNWYSGQSISKGISPILGHDPQIKNFRKFINFISPTWPSITALVEKGWHSQPDRSFQATPSKFITDEIWIQVEQWFDDLIANWDQPYWVLKQPQS